MAPVWSALIDLGNSGQAFEMRRQRCAQSGVVGLGGRRPGHHHQVVSVQLRALLSKSLSGQTLEAVALHRVAYLFF